MLEEKIDLGMLKRPDGATLAIMIGNRPAVIAVIDNECGICTIAADQMQYVHDQIAQAGLQYFIVSFTSSGPPLRFFQYADSLHIDAPAFLWANDKGHPPESLFTMVVPSHFLIDQFGVVRQVWPGANDSKLIRDKMANQIVNDTLKILASGS